MTDAISDERRARIARLVGRLGDDAGARRGRGDGEIEELTFGLLGLAALGLLVATLASAFGDGRAPVGLAGVAGLVLVAVVAYSRRAETRLGVYVALVALPPLLLQGADPTRLELWEPPPGARLLIGADIALALVEAVAVVGLLGLLRNPWSLRAARVAAVAGGLLVLRGLAPPLLIAPRDSAAWGGYAVGAALVALCGALALMAAIDRDPAHRQALALVAGLVWLPSLGARLAALAARVGWDAQLLIFGLPALIGMAMLLTSCAARDTVDDAPTPSPDDD